ncbi:MAG: endolytic transglycosylase MltG [Clostridia bacterium]|nr:endolytic transglycosylase MltG [Clostridia bacterium]
MSNDGKPRFEINIDDFDFESGFDSGAEDSDIDTSFLDGYDHYDSDDNTPAKSGGSGGGSAHAKKKGEGGFILRVIIALAVAFAAIGLSLACFSVADDLLGMEKRTGTVVVDIPQGASVSEIGQILADKGVIKYPAVFKFYVGNRYSNTSFSSGQIAIDLSLASGYDNIVSEIKQPYLAETVRLSFPEGYTIQQIANKLEENGVCSASNFLAAIKVVDFSGYDFVKKIDYTDKYLALEGYIFPDTYDFYLNDNAANVVRRFLDNFEVRFTEDMEARAKELGMTIDEVIIFASIVQMEAGDPKEMGRVASVFHNRLNNTAATQGRLESDVTINYVEQYIRPNVDASEMDAYSFNYNTYKCIGIPAGAVCNPGLAAINATLYPAETNYYFFVTDVLGNYYYATTLAEHNENVAKAFAVGKEG